MLIPPRVDVKDKDSFAHLIGPFFLDLIIPGALPALIPAKGDNPGHSAGFLASPPAWIMASTASLDKGARPTFAPP